MRSRLRAPEDDTAVTRAAAAGRSGSSSSRSAAGSKGAGTHIPGRALAALAIIVSLAMTSCGPAAQIFAQGGQKQLHAHLQPAVTGSRVLIFAMDGAGYDQFMEAVSSGHAKNIEALFGRVQANGLYEHACSLPNAITVLPTTMPAWTSVFTGEPPANTGVTGDEFFIREQNQLYAPVPVSLSTHEDTFRMLSNNLLGKLIETPTLYEFVKVRSYVSLNGVYRGADVFTDLDRTAYVSIAAEMLKSVAAGTSPADTVFARIDEDSTTTLIENMQAHGVPDLQVVYFPGVDLFTHHTPDPLGSQVIYLETVTDYAVGRVLDYYRKVGVLDHTYVFFIADHGHTPTVPDRRHALGSEAGADPLPALLKRVGFRPRPFALKLSSADEDYQAVVTYEGVLAYVYLADRSLCRDEGKNCDWRKPPRLEEDVMPVVRALYRSNQIGDPIPDFKGTLDLIFARLPVTPGQKTLPFKIFEGNKLVPIPVYLARHPRPDLIQLDQRMKWLGAGPYGDRAGDIIVLPRFRMQDPIQDRYHFGQAYYSEHGSPSQQDGHIPFLLARTTLSGQQLQALLGPNVDSDPTQLDVVPLMRRLLRRATAEAKAIAK